MMLNPDAPHSDLLRRWYEIEVEICRLREAKDLEPEIGAILIDALEIEQLAIDALLGDQEWRC